MREESTRPARNLNEAKIDRSNQLLAESIMEALAPLGFQSHRKYGEVAIREALSKKECMDITYKVIITATKDKVSFLKSIKKDATSTSNQLSGLTQILEELDKEYGNNFWMWLSGKLGYYRMVYNNRRQLIGRLEALQDFRTIVLTTGPEIPEEIMIKQQL